MLLVLGKSYSLTGKKYFGKDAINGHSAALRAYMMNTNSFEGLDISIQYAVFRKAYSKIWKSYQMSKIKFEFLCLLRTLEELDRPFIQLEMRKVFSGKHSDLRFLREWSELEGFVLDGSLTLKAHRVFRTFDEEVSRLILLLGL